MHLRLVREDPDGGLQYRDMYVRSHMQEITMMTYVRELSEYLLIGLNMTCQTKGAVDLR